MQELEKIIEGCKRKETASQEKLYRMFYPALYTLCKTFFKDKHDVITALNNGMLRVFAQIDKYDVSKGSLYNWMHTVVRNTTLTYLRDSKQIRTIEITEAVQEIITENPFTKFNRQDLFTILAVLPTDTRAVVVLFYIEQFSVKEIAFILQMKDGTVKWHLSEGRKKLKNLIKAEIFSER